MPAKPAFSIPPYSGNAIADAAYYAVFLVVQIGLVVLYLRRWNWPIFMGLILFLLLETLGSIAYLKLHYVPETGAWYSL